jgi:hypothetical protein
MKGNWSKNSCPRKIDKELRKMKGGVYNTDERIWTSSFKKVNLSLCLKTAWNFWFSCSWREEDELSDHAAFKGSWMPHLLRQSTSFISNGKVHYIHNYGFQTISQVLWFHKKFSYFLEKNRTYFPQKRM